MNKEPGGESLRAPLCLPECEIKGGIIGAHVLVGLRENPDVGIYVRHVSANRDDTMLRGCDSLQVPVGDLQDGPFLRLAMGSSRNALTILGFRVLSFTRT